MEAKRIEDIEEFKDSTIITIGVFDGVHLAHEQIFKELLRIAKERNLIPVVITFYPHPDKVLGKGNTPLIQTLSQRVNKIKEKGIKFVIPVKFDRDFYMLSALDFISLLIEKFKMKGILVGENFHFGKGMEGNVDFLKRIGSERKIEVFTIKIFEFDGKRLSSSLIRNMLLQGKVEEASPLLGRFYSITGKIVQGLGIGKKLGIPTANIKTENEILPEGVFITEASIKGLKLPSVTNIGRAPTLKNTEKSVETHIIDFEREILNQEIEIFFIKKIRDEIKFESPEALKERIKEDIKIAKEFFIKHK